MVCAPCQVWHGLGTAPHPHPLWLQTLCEEDITNHNSKHPALTGLKLKRRLIKLRNWSPREWTWRLAIHEPAGIQTSYFCSLMSKHSFQCLTSASVQYLYLPSLSSTFSSSVAPSPSPCTPPTASLLDTVGAKGSSPEHAEKAIHSLIGMTALQSVQRAQEILCTEVYRHAECMPAMSPWCYIAHYTPCTRATYMTLGTYGGRETDS